MQFSMLMEQIKSALKTPDCVFCNQSIATTGIQTQWLCSSCEAVLGLRLPSRNRAAPTQTLYTACRLGEVIKKKIYQYKFYSKTSNRHLLTGILNHFWHACVQQNVLLQQTPETVLVTIIPSHGSKASHMERIAKSFASQWHYGFNPSIFKWKRPVKPQHAIQQRQHRLKNVQNSLFCPVELSQYQFIVVVDDILTTGATLKEAKRAINNSVLANGKRPQYIGLTIANTP